VMRQSARMRRGPFRLAELFAPITVPCFWTIDRSVLSKFGAVPARLERVLTVAAAKI
jgi:hypothetical protein